MDDHFVSSINPDFIGAVGEYNKYLIKTRLAYVSGVK